VRIGSAQVEHVEQAGTGMAAQQVGFGVQQTGCGVQHWAYAPPARPIEANATAKKRIAMSASPCRKGFLTRDPVNDSAGCAGPNDATMVVICRYDGNKKVWIPCKLLRGNNMRLY
jgi:hypothetical protein